MFEFRGKSGVMHKTAFHDARLARVLRGCEALHGQRLFPYVDHDGATHAIGSHDVNAYIREAIGDDFSAKDFRTWMGTLAGRPGAGGSAGEPATETTRRSGRSPPAVKAVAGLLGNTPTVCRGACYIHPQVFDAYRQGHAFPPPLKSDGPPQGRTRPVEAAVGGRPERGSGFRRSLARPDPNLAAL